MLEETLIRENASKKITKRNLGNSSMVTPPVTLVNPVDQSTASNAAAEEGKEEMKNFDVVSSPTLPDFTEDLKGMPASNRMSMNIS